MLWSAQIKWFLRWPGGRLDHINGGQRHSNGEFENKSRKPRDLTENRHSDSLKKGQLTFFQSKIMKGDKIADDDTDDALRTIIRPSDINTVY
jgi:hypothetical protein